MRMEGALARDCRESNGTSGGGQVAISPATPARCSVCLDASKICWLQSRPCRLAVLKLLPCVPGRLQRDRPRVGPRWQACARRWTAGLPSRRVTMSHFVPRCCIALSAGRPLRRVNGCCLFSRPAISTNTSALNVGHRLGPRQTRPRTTSGSLDPDPLSDDSSPRRTCPHRTRCPEPVFPHSSRTCTNGIFNSRQIVQSSHIVNNFLTPSC